MSTQQTVLGTAMVVLLLLLLCGILAFLVITNKLLVLFQNNWEVKESSCDWASLGCVGLRGRYPWV